MKYQEQLDWLKNKATVVYLQQNYSPEAMCEIAKWLWEYQQQSTPLSNPDVSGELPSDGMVSKEEYENAINKIGELQEQLSDAEQEIKELSRELRETR